MHPRQRAKPADQDTRRLHQHDHRLVDGSGAVGVEQHSNPSTFARLRGQTGGELLTDGSGPVDERQEIDRVLGTVDRIEHRWEDGVTVLQHIDSIALGRRNADHAFEVTPQDLGSVTLIA